MVTTSVVDDRVAHDARSKLVATVVDSAIHFPSIFIPQVLSGRGFTEASVVGADRSRGVTECGDLLGEHPSADVDVCAHVPQVILDDVESRKLWEPDRVDLHDSDVVRTVAVLVVRMAVEVALDASDRTKKFRGDFVPGCGIVKTISLNDTGRCENKYCTDAG